MRWMIVSLLWLAVQVILAIPAPAQTTWSREVYDVCGDASAAYDITYAKAWHDGNTFYVKIGLDQPYSTAPFSIYGARIYVAGAIYALAFVTESSYWGPKLGVSYDNGTSWNLAGGSPSGAAGPKEITLQVPIANIGAMPWRVDFISAVWWWFNSYQILDSTSAFTVPAPLAPFNVEARQRSDGSHIVDIYYDLWLPVTSRVYVALAVSNDGGASYNITPTSVSGQIGPGVMSGPRRHIIWDAEKDLPGTAGTNYRVKVSVTN